MSRGPFGLLDEVIQTAVTRGDPIVRTRIGNRDVLFFCGHDCGYAWREQGVTYNVFGHYPQAGSRSFARKDMRAVVRRLELLAP